MTHTFLLVEDTDIDRYYAHCILEELYPKCNIVDACDGQEALEMLQKNQIQPDLIFLDLNMPRMNGYDFLDIYDKKLGCKSPVCILSSSEDSRDLSQTSFYDCVIKYIVKPLSEEALSALCLCNSCTKPKNL